jgi:hypothetical protein
MIVLCLPLDYDLQLFLQCRSHTGHDFDDGRQACVRHLQGRLVDQNDGR